MTLKKATYFLVFLLFAIALPVLAKAQKVDQTEAQLAAESFLSHYEESGAVTRSAGALISLGIYKGMETYYVFNVSNGGFVIIAADKRVFPLLAYSFEGNFSAENVSPEFSWWMNQYDEQIVYCASHNLPAGMAAQNAWDNLLSGKPLPTMESKGVKSVEPLLHSTWDQGSYYNMLCPEDPDGPGGHVWSGCVATCMAQTMYYYRYPDHGTGSHGYNSNYGYLFADFGNTTYDWNAMQDNINGYYNTEMSKIQYHCGIAVDMMYSATGSGAYMNDAADAMINYFGYNSGGQMYHRDDYIDSQWKSMLRGNLDNKWPIIYAGHGPGGGHAFVCDGYEGTDHFHFNWGWSGAYDGYFYLDNLNPGYTFTSNQQAGLDLHPPDIYPVPCSGTKTVTSSRGSIEDGSGPIKNYQNNADCYWLIAPSEPTQYITLQFRDFITHDSNDVLTIYDGATTADSILGVYSGNNLPASINSGGDKMLLHFTSDNVNNESGWFVSYKAVKFQFCTGLKEMTDVAGSFSDGSGNYNYNNSTLCHWRIAPAGARSIILSFSAMDIEPGNDMLKIFDEETSTEIAQFDGNSIPASMTIYTGRVFLTFFTDAMVTAQGWDASYTSSTSSVDDHSAITGLLIYPNPVTDYLTLTGNATEQEILNICIADSRGSLVRKKFANTDISGRFTSTIDVSGLSAGVYFLELSGSSGISHYKFLVR